MSHSKLQEDILIITTLHILSCVANKMYIYPCMKSRYETCNWFPQNILKMFHLRPRIRKLTNASFPLIEHFIVNSPFIYQSNRDDPNRWYWNPQCNSKASQKPWEYEHLMRTDGNQPAAHGHGLPTFLSKQTKLVLTT